MSWLSFDSLPAAVFRIVHRKVSWNQFGICLSNIISSNSWSFSRDVFPINEIRISISPCSNILDSRSSMSFLIVASGALSLCSSPPLVPLAPLALSMRQRSEGGPCSFVPHVSVFDAVLFLCIMTGYMVPGTCTKKTLPCPAVETARSQASKLIKSVLLL